jgi:PAS domain-containing protein
LTDEPAYGAALTLRAELRGGVTRIVIANSDQGTSLAIADPLLQKAIGSELDALRQILAQAPLPIWRERTNGDVVWCNRDYLARVRERLPEGEDLSWPLPRLFDRTASAQGVAGQRQCISSADNSCRS